jgi:hypothetical protein
MKGVLKVIIITITITITISAHHRALNPGWKRDVHARSMSGIRACRPE